LPFNDEPFWPPELAVAVLPELEDDDDDPQAIAAHATPAHAPIASPFFNHFISISSPFCRGSGWRYQSRAGEACRQ
jgi:hypothetical protein